MAPRGQNHFKAASLGHDAFWWSADYLTRNVSLYIYYSMGWNPQSGMDLAHELTNCGAQGWLSLKKQIITTSSGIAWESSNIYPDPSDNLHVWDFLEDYRHSYVQDRPHKDTQDHYEPYHPRGCPADCLNSCHPVYNTQTLECSGPSLFRLVVLSAS